MMLVKAKVALKMLPHNLMQFQQLSIGTIHQPLLQEKLELKSSKKYSVMENKMIFRHVASSIFLISISSVALSDCIKSETNAVQSNAEPKLSFDVQTCYIKRTSGTNIITVLKDGKPIQTLKSAFDARAYAVQADADFDIDADGIADFAINTGKGRGGEGMHYWRYVKSTSKFIDLGEAPLLVRSKQSADHHLYSLVSSSGAYQAFIYEYAVKNNKLVLLSALGFMPASSNGGEDYNAIAVKPTADESFKKIGKPKPVKADIGNKCMEDVSACSLLPLTKNAKTKN